eukprot:4405910-Pleurochrysis_carterae.AAC.2
MRVPGCKESSFSGSALVKIEATSARKSRSQKRQKVLVEVSSKTALSMGMGEGERKQGGLAKRMQFRLFLAKAKG